MGRGNDVQEVMGAMAIPILYIHTYIHTYKDTELRCPAASASSSSAVTGFSQIPLFALFLLLHPKQLVFFKLLVCSVSFLGK